MIAGWGDSGVGESSAGEGLAGGKFFAGPDAGAGATGRVDGMTVGANDERFKIAARCKYAETSRKVTTVTATKNRTPPRTICLIDGRGKMLPSIRRNTTHPVSLVTGVIPPFRPCYTPAGEAGLMFWFKRKKLLESYLVFSATNRSYFRAP